MKLRAFTTYGQEAIAHEIIRGLYLERTFPFELEVTIVTPHEVVPELVPPDELEIWLEIHEAWRSLQEKTISKQYDAWQILIKHGSLLTPNDLTFALRTRKDSFFGLVPEAHFEDIVLSRFGGIYSTLLAWSHVALGRQFLHASSVTRNHNAYLFLGQSGAGKSTIAQLSTQVGAEIIHDDHTLIFLDETGHYKILDRNASLAPVEIKAIFVIKQNARDGLQRISPEDLLVHLYNSMFETDGTQVLFGERLNRAFSMLADVARTIPGYDLHFRKSPDFWDLIDAEFTRKT